MTFRPLWCVTLAGILAGCAEDRPETVYHEPLTSPGGQFAMLPPTVQNSVRAQTGAAEIAGISKDTSTGEPVYEFQFKNAEMFPPLYVAPDGSVLTSNRQVAVGASADTIEAATGSAVNGVRLDDLPPNVIKTIRNKAPTAEVDSIDRIRSGHEVFYEVFFKDPSNHPKLFIADDGRLVQ